MGHHDRGITGHVEHLRGSNRGPLAGKSIDAEKLLGLSSVKPLMC